ncbi:unnamed protein product [Pieris brassicae]|uniref:Uncharacterized protein n=1 Tax=Pieris brassicae TaxID=7116 RepID=A0A9P0SJZ1_PIEBR|nr:unnamed protein product [Pieris brassicae]
MATPKNKSEINVEHEPVKKMKVEEEKVKNSRTVATMCGAWRPEEEYGGLVFVFKERQEALSPTPINECDFPENIEDFWEASLGDGCEIQNAPSVITQSKQQNKRLLQSVDNLQ